MRKEFPETRVILSFNGGAEIFCFNSNEIKTEININHGYESQIFTSKGGISTSLSRRTAKRIRFNVTNHDPDTFYKLRRIHTIIRKSYSCRVILTRFWDVVQPYRKACNPGAFASPRGFIWNSAGTTAEIADYLKAFGFIAATFTPDPLPAVPGVSNTKLIPVMDYATKISIPGDVPGHGDMIAINGAVTPFEDAALDEVLGEGMKWQPYTMVAVLEMGNDFHNIALVGGIMRTETEFNLYESIAMATDTTDLPVSEDIEVDTGGGVLIDPLEATGGK